MHILPDNFRPNWADRVALYVAAFLAASAVLMSLMVLLAVGSISYVRFDVALFNWAGGTVVVLSLIVWAVLRGSDAAARAIAQGWRRFLSAESIQQPRRGVSLSWIRFAHSIRDGLHLPGSPSH